MRLVGNVMSKKMKIFNVRSISSLLRTTLEWETFEQYCVWQLISAESVPSESVGEPLRVPPAELSLLYIINSNTACWVFCVYLYLIFNKLDCLLLQNFQPRK